VRQSELGQTPPFGGPMISAPMMMLRRLLWSRNAAAHCVLRSGRGGSASAGAALTGVRSAGRGAGGGSGGGATGRFGCASRSIISRICAGTVGEDAMRGAGRAVGGKMGGLARGRGRGTDGRTGASSASSLVSSVLESLPRPFATITTTAMISQMMKSMLTASVMIRWSRRLCRRLHRQWIGAFWSRLGRFASGSNP